MILRQKEGQNLRVAVGSCITQWYFSVLCFIRGLRASFYQMFYDFQVTSFGSIMK